MIIDSAGFSYIGARLDQEDNIFCDKIPPYFLFAVSDGMGGQEGGAVASKRAITKLVEDTKNFVNMKTSISRFLYDELITLDEEIFQITDQKRKWINCGATLVVGLIKGDELYWASVGDSRLYISRDKKMLQATRDHNYRMKLDELLETKRINEHQYKAELSMSDLLISHLGMGNMSLMDVPDIPFKLYKGDCLVLCTDGVYKTITDDEIKEIVNSYPTAGICSEKMEDLIKNKKYKEQDNASGIIVKIL